MRFRPESFYLGIDKLREKAEKLRQQPKKIEDGLGAIIQAAQRSKKQKK